MHRSETAVLFVSRENAARSLLAEACLRHLGQSRFKVFSCGVPALSDGQPSEWALLALKTAGMSIAGLRCKAWTDFTRSGAPRMDFVIALDQETSYQHPLWRGQPETATWAYDPLVARKDKSMDLALAALNTLHSLRRRIELLVALHARGVARSDLRHDLRDMSHL
jgi:protein-tyrosine-phosphatase